MLEPKQEDRYPRKLYKKFYQLLAAGRYAAEWVPEFIELYELVLAEEGQEAADIWALHELSLGVKFSIGLRIYRIIRLAYKAREAYRKAAKD